MYAYLLTNGFSSLQNNNFFLLSESDQRYYNFFFLNIFLSKQKWTWFAFLFHQL